MIKVFKRSHLDQLLRGSSSGYYFYVFIAAFWLKTDINA